MFSPAEAAYLGHALEPYRLYFYEDPIRPLNPQSLRTVRDKVNLPLATGEQLAHKWEFQPLIENELLDYLRIDLVHAGGITEAKKILAAGEVHGQRSALHHASSPVNGAACLHVDLAVPNFGIQEWMELEPLYELFPNAPRAEAGYVRRRPARGSASSSTKEAAAPVAGRPAAAALLARRQRRGLQPVSDLPPIDSPETLPGWHMPWPAFAVDWERAALVVIDVQNYGCREAGLGPMLRSAIPRSPATTCRV